MKDQLPVHADAATMAMPGSAALMAQIATLQQALAAKEKRDSRTILRIAAVEEKTSRKKSWIYAAVRAGTFPAPISLGGRASGWVSTDIDDWLDAKITAARSRHPNHS